MIPKRVSRRLKQTAFVVFRAKGLTTKISKSSVTNLKINGYFENKNSCDVIEWCSVGFGMGPINLCFLFSKIGIALKRIGNRCDFLKQLLSLTPLKHLFEY